MIDILDFISLKFNDQIPIYMQIIRYVKINIVQGYVNDGDELPSRRVLSAILGVNPNTIQKAYKYMEDEGFVITFAGSKSCLKFDNNVIQKIRQTLLSSEAIQYIDNVKQLGLGLEQAKNLIEAYWGEKYDANA